MFILSKRYTRQILLLGDAIEGENAGIPCFRLVFTYNWTSALTYCQLLVKD